MRGAALLPILALACGGGSGSGAPDAGPGPDAPGDAFDLAGATWQLEQVATTTEHSSFPVVAFTGDGRPLVVWEEGREAVMAAVRDSGGWQATEIFRAPGELVSQVAASPASGGGAHIAFDATTPDTGRDIYYVAFDGDSFAAAVDLTGAGQTATQNDEGPAVVENPGGSVSVIYSLRDSSPREIRMLTFTDAAQPGQPTPLVDQAEDCGQSLAVTDADGFVHALVNCVTNSQLRYLSNKSGSFKTQIVDRTGAQDAGQPALAVASSGRVDVGFRGRVDCPGGSGICHELFLSSNLAPPLPITRDPDGDWGMGAMLLDGFDRAIVVFDDNSEGKMKWSFIQGGSFFRSLEVVPGAAVLDTMTAGGGATDPATGLPLVAFERAEGLANADIWVARLVPP